MDPNTALEIIDQLLLQHRFNEAREARTDLIAWLARGGFAPDWSKFPKATEYVNEAR